MQNYNIRFKDGTVTEVKDVVSETKEDVPLYDLSNYRNELDASYMGREWIESPVSGNPEFADERLNAVAPQNEEKMRTRYILWSEAAGAGDMLAWFWADEVRGISTGTFSRV